MMDVVFFAPDAAHELTVIADVPRVGDEVFFNGESPSETRGWIVARVQTVTHTFEGQARAEAHVYLRPKPDLISCALRSGLHAAGCRGIVRARRK